MDYGKQLKIIVIAYGKQMLEQPIIKEPKITYGKQLRIGNNHQ